MASSCETCKLRSYAERKPNSLISKIWRWHTKWCPGWKAYQAKMTRQQEESGNQKQASAPGAATKAIHDKLFGFLFNLC